MCEFNIHLLIVVVVAIKEQPLNIRVMYKYQCNREETKRIPTINETPLNFHSQEEQKDRTDEEEVVVKVVGVKAGENSIPTINNGAISVIENGEEEVVEEVVPTESESRSRWHLLDRILLAKELANREEDAKFQLGCSVGNGRPVLSGRKWVILALPSSHTRKIMYIGRTSYTKFPLARDIS